MHQRLAAAESRLNWRRERKKVVATGTEAWEEEAAVLKMRASALENDIRALRREIKSRSRGGVDLQAEEAEIAIAEQMAREIGMEVERVQIELKAPPRIRVLAKARTPSPGPWLAWSGL